MSDDIRNKIVWHLKIGEFTKAEQDEILAKLQENIVEKINLTIFDMLPPADLALLPKLRSEDPTGKKLREFLVQKIPNLPFLTEAIANSVVAEFLRNR